MIRGRTAGAAAIIDASASGALRDFLRQHSARASLELSAGLEGRHVKSLFFEGGVVAVVFAEDTVDVSRLARAARRPTTKLAAIDVAERETGFQMGTLSPVGVPNAVAIVVDSRVARWGARVLGGGGSMELSLVLESGSELVRLARESSPLAVVAEIATTSRPEEATADRGASRRLAWIDASGAAVETSGVIVAKREIANGLCFLSVEPSYELLEHALCEDADEAAPVVRARGGRRRRLWRPSTGGRTLELQLIVGKTLERAVGKPALANKIRRLRVGQRILFVALPQWERRPLYDWRRYFGREARARRAQLRGARQLDLRCASLEIVQGERPPAAERHERRQRRRAEPVAPGDCVRVPEDCAISLVDDLASLEAMRATLDALPDGQVIGLDAEWQPDVPSQSQPSPAAVLQLATRDAAFVVDLAALALVGTGGLVDAAIQRCAGRATLVGYGVETDVARLRLAGVACFEGVRIVDAQVMASRAADRPVGLSEVSRAFLGAPLDKRLQRSAWATAPRPLAAELVAYAALDAIVLPRCYEQLLTLDASSSPFERRAPRKVIVDADDDDGEPSSARAKDLYLDDQAHLTAMLGCSLRVLGGFDEAPRGDDSAAADVSCHPKDAALLSVSRQHDLGLKAVSGYDRRGGVVRVGDASAFFVNWGDDNNRKGNSFNRKYPNVLRAATNDASLLELSWWPPPNMNVETRLSAEPAHFFARVGKEPFVYLGQLKFGRPLSDDSDLPTSRAPNGQVLELIQSRQLIASDSEPLRRLLERAARP